MPVIPATQEAEAGELPEPRRQRLRWAEVAPLHSSLGNKSKTPSQKKNKKKTLSSPNHSLKLVYLTLMLQFMWMFTSQLKHSMCKIEPQPIMVLLYTSLNMSKQHPHYLIHAISLKSSPTTRYLPSLFYCQHWPLYYFNVTGSFYLLLPLVGILFSQISK